MGKPLQILLSDWVPWGLPSLPMAQAFLELFSFGAEPSPHTLGTYIYTNIYTLAPTRIHEIFTYVHIDMCIQHVLTN